MRSVSTGGEEVAPPDAERPGGGDLLTLFALLWGVAALFHNIGPSGRAHAIWLEPTLLKASHVLLSAAALWLILRPRSLRPLIAVAVLSPITAWLEAPRLGNHWLLAGFIDIGILIALVAGRFRGRLDRESLAAAILPTARWCLVIFYSFAAFAKLNSAFFDPAVSCGTFFFDETARSYGLETPIAVASEDLGRLITIGSALTELSVPLLLLFRRTRVLGVVLGLLFHSVIALDRIHLFVDFSSLLAALFLLFMPAGFATSAIAFVEGKSEPLFRFMAALAMLVVACQVLLANNLMAATFLQGRMVLWYLVDMTLLIGTIGWLLRNRGAYRQPRNLFKLPDWVRPPATALLVVVALNGLLPYLELRTAYAYTMYSNLKMVDGESNHFLVQRSFPVGDRHDDLVRVISSTDFGGLQRYVNSGYQLPWDTFRAYTAEHPNLAVTYERGGRRFILERVADNPELLRPPPLLVQKAFPLRTVDTRDPAKCQDVFLPAL